MDVNNSVSSDGFGSCYRLAWRTTTTVSCMYSTTGDLLKPDIYGIYKKKLSPIGELFVKTPHMCGRLFLVCGMLSASSTIQLIVSFIYLPQMSVA